MCTAQKCQESYLSLPHSPSCAVTVCSFCRQRHLGGPKWPPRANSIPSTCNTYFIFCAPTLTHGRAAALARDHSQASQSPRAGGLNVEDPEVDKEEERSEAGDDGPVLFLIPEKFIL